MSSSLFPQCLSSFLPSLFPEPPLTPQPPSPTTTTLSTTPRTRRTRNCTSSRSNYVICCLTVDHDRHLQAVTTASPPPSSSWAGLRIAFAAGGTGGHIYPAIAIAEEIKNACPDAEILFIGSAAGMESTIVPSAGYNYSPVPSTLLAGPIFSPLNLLFPFQLLYAVACTWDTLRKFRPEIVVSTGGFVAAPVCIAAALSGLKFAVQEQNSYPGLANRLIAPYAEKIFLAFNACVKEFDKKKCLVYGNPVRLSLRSFVSKAVARSHFFPNIKKKGEEEEKAQVVLVLGGLMSANSINIAVLNMYYDMLLENKNRYIIWQTGPDAFNEMESLVRSNQRLMLTPFLHEMDMAYAAADVVVSQAGAMTCTEILATGKPSILIPLYTAADDLQINNAYIMADIAGSKILEEDELDSSSLEDAIDEILGNEQLMAEMSEKALIAAKPNAAADIAQCILSLVKLPSME